MPEITKTATHVYVEIEKPDNLGKKYLGPFPVVNHPSPSTLTVLVGYYKTGLPRLEVHSWDRCRVAHMRPEAAAEERPQIGRRRKFPATASDGVASTTDESQQTSVYAQLQNQNKITQPRYQSDRFELLAPSSAEPAELGGQQQKQTAPPNGEYYETSLPEPDPVATSSSSEGYASHPYPNEARVVPPRKGTNGTAQPSIPVDETPAATAGHAFSSPALPPQQFSGPALPPQAGHHLQDHDYTSHRPPSLTDHNYFMTVPLPETVTPPPGFSRSGRPIRTRNLPVRLNDYDLSQA